VGRVTVEFHRHADILEALADEHLVPLPATPGPPGSLGWLRNSAARFSSGGPHARRRALVLDELRDVDPEALFQAAATSPSTDTRRQVVETLAAAMNLPDPPAIAEAVAVIAPHWFDGSDADADRAAALLVRRLGGANEAVANRIGLLVQACDATAGLIDNARRHAGDLATTLKTDPPVRVMRRTAVHDTVVAGVPIAAGDLVVFDVAAASREPDAQTLTFGGPPRPCPGRQHALAIAAGALTNPAFARGRHE
jgi:hypothetical protein